MQKNALVQSGLARIIVDKFRKPLGHKAGGWTHLFWHKGVKLSGKLLRQVEAILYTVIDDEE